MTSLHRAIRPLLPLLLALPLLAWATLHAPPGLAEWQARAAARGARLPVAAPFRPPASAAPLPGLALAARTGDGHRATRTASATLHAAALLPIALACPPAAALFALSPGIARDAALAGAGLGWGAIFIFLLLYNFIYYKYFGTRPRAQGFHPCTPPGPRAPAPDLPLEPSTARIMHDDRSSPAIPPSWRAGMVEASSANGGPGPQAPAGPGAEPRKNIYTIIILIYYFMFFVISLALAATALFLLPATPAGRGAALEAAARLLFRDPGAAAWGILLLLLVPASLRRLGIGDNREVRRGAALNPSRPPELPSRIPRDRAEPGQENGGPGSVTPAGCRGGTPARQSAHAPLPIAPIALAAALALPFGGAPPLLALAALALAGETLARLPRRHAAALLLLYALAAGLDAHASFGRTEDPRDAEFAPAAAAVRSTGAPLLLAKDWSAPLLAELSGIPAVGFPTLQATGEAELARLDPAVDAVAHLPRLAFVHHADDDGRGAATSDALLARLAERFTVAPVGSAGLMKVFLCESREKPGNE